MLRQWREDSYANWMLVRARVPLRDVRMATLAAVHRRAGQRANLRSSDVSIRPAAVVGDRPISGRSPFATYGGKFIRTSIALNCGSLRMGSSSQFTLSPCKPDSRNRSALSKVRSASALLPNWA